MTLLKPTTSQLMERLPSWLIGPGDLQGPDVLPWQAKNVPWVWTPEEFEMQTRMLAMNECAPRDMVAWLIHGVRWSAGASGSPGSLRFEDQVLFWKAKAPYLRAWVEGHNAGVPEEALEALCKRLSWHEAWRNSNLANVIDDFYWARELAQAPSKAKAPRRPRSPLGSLELSHVSQEQGFQYRCAECIVKNMRWGSSAHNMQYSGTKELLESTTLGELPLPFQRGLLMASLQNANTGILSPEGLVRLRRIWTSSMPPEEQNWWESKSKTMAFTQDISQDLLDKGIHPLELVHRSRAQDLELFKDLNPQAFRSGYALMHLLAQSANQSTLPLPDLDGLAP